MTSVTSVDSDDLLLVVKALEQRQNFEMKCWHQHEEDSAFFDEEDVAIGLYETHINCLNLMCFEVTITGEFRSASENSAAEMLVIKFNEMSSPKALAWCGRQLIYFHEEHQCSQYMSSALKFYLKAHEMVKKAYFHDNCVLNKRALRYFRLSSENKVHQSVFVECLRVFCMSNGYSPYGILDDVLRIAHEAKIDVLKIWESEVEKSSFRFFYYSLFAKIENLVSLIKYGKTEGLSAENYVYHRYWMSAVSRVSESMVNVTELNSKTVRSLQILYLHFFNSQSPFMSSRALKLLWNSITDPFLTKEEFCSSFAPTKTSEQTLLQLAWTWYEEHVLENRTLTKSPRSLLHLSRFSVREQMAKSLQLPAGVEMLHVPKVVKRYILLEC
ncbi:uncharacterized protein [Parasteatoda tepidariorum]|uniref:uncharacterized protein n=1 Tax=Parasteatoda tepidariorum TaxID=114398 RepID=UPI00077FCF7A|nr:uncharacterized protein LOC107452058 [Parasteatoda tepidariorum]